MRIDLSHLVAGLEISLGFHLETDLGCHLEIGLLVFILRIGLKDLPMRIDLSHLVAGLEISHLVVDLKTDLRVVDPGCHPETILNHLVDRLEIDP